MKWIARATWRNPQGLVRGKEKEYDQPAKPDKTRVIRDLVPQDCTTLTLSIRKVRLWPSIKCSGSQSVVRGNGTS